MISTIITALHRPEDTVNAFANARRQRARFVVVENGAGVGACEAYGLKPDVLLQSEPHQSHARNAGLHWLRKNGGGFWLTFDADDIYGPRYVRKMEACCRRGDVLGQRSVFVQYSSGRLVLYGKREPTEGRGAAGSTLCGWSDCVDFRGFNEAAGEDSLFISDMKAAGAKIYNPGPAHHIYRRHTANIWQMSDERTDALFQLRCGVGVGEDFGIVSGSMARDIVESGAIGPKLEPISFEAQRNALIRGV